MNEERYENYKEDHQESLMLDFIEEYEEEFEDFCFKRFEDFDPSDDIYDRWKDEQAEEKYNLR